MTLLTSGISIPKETRMSDADGNSVDIEPVRKQMFLDFCAALTAKDIPYVILAGHKEYPEKIASDIDFMVSDKDFLRLPSILNDPACVPGARIVQMLQHETSARYYVLAQQVGNRIAYIHPDSATDYRQNGRHWMYSDPILATRRRSRGGFWIPAAAFEFEYYFVKRIEKACLETHHLKELSALLSEDPAGCIAVLTRLTPPNLTGSIVTAIAALDVEWFAKSKDSLRKSLLSSNNPESLVDQIFNRCSESLRVIRRIIHPTGFVIAVLGPDGSGKTTVIEHIAREFAPAFRNVKRFHLRPHFGNLSMMDAVSNPHDQMPRHRLTSAMKVALFLVDYWIGWLRFIAPDRIRSTLVIFDRYYHDMLVDYKRYRLPRGFSVARWFAPLVPQPDLWIILTANANLLVSRKGEISIRDGEYLKTAYESLARDLVGSVVIDTSGPLEQSLADAVTAVRERLESRAQESLKNL